MDKRIRSIFVKAELFFYSAFGLLLAFFAYLKSGIQDGLSVFGFVVLIIIIDKLCKVYKKRYDKRRKELN